MVTQIQYQSRDLRNFATAHLTNTMRLIEKTCVELEAEIATELAENPALQIVDQHHCPECRQPVENFPCPNCEMRRRSMDQDEPIIYLSPRSAALPPPRSSQDDMPFASRVRQPESLRDYALRQLVLDLKEGDRKIAEHVLERLDERGFLEDTLIEIAAYLHVLPSQIEHVVKLIQRVDPVGIATQNVRECLLVQIDVLTEEKCAHPLAEEILAEHWQLLGQRDFKTIARKCQVNIDEVEAAAQFIRRNLTPFPARASWGEDDRNDGRYYNPDAKIMKNPYNPEGALMAELYTPTGGLLQVDPHIRAAVKQVTDEDDRSEWSEYLERAALFAKCLRQRNNAMRRILSVIIERQRSFILGGNSDLIPITRAELADEVEVHESTVSRAVSGKTVALPNGRIIPLSRFFDRSLPVREAVRTIIDLESKPLTDQQISAELKDFGYQVARRTVAKYRSMLGILPANIRARQLSAGYAA